MNAKGFSPTVSGERIEIIRTLEGLAAAAPQWAALWARSDAPIFQHPAWIEAWWRHAPETGARAPMIALAWSGERLAGVLALNVVRRKGLRMLEWAAKDCSDYCDGLIEHGGDIAVLSRLWQAVTAAGGFDVIHLNRLLPQAAAWALATPEQGGARLRPNRRSELNYRVIGPFADGEAWFNGFPKKVRQNYKRGVKFLGEGASLAFRLLPEDAPLGPIVARLGVLKRQWLARNGIVAPLFDEGTPLLPALLEVLRAAGQLRVFVLEREGEIIAISVNFVQRDVMMAFLTSYDPAVERGSPGMVLMVDYIRWAFDNGLNVVDFLCGDEGFKSRFATQEVTLASLAGSRTLLGHAGMAADHLLTLARRSRHSAPAAKAEPEFA